MAPSNQALLTGVIVAMPVAALFAVALRIYARRVSSRSWWLDDYTVLVTMAFAIAQATFAYLTVRDGEGTHIHEVPDVPSLLFHSYLQEIFVHPCIAGTKFAIIFFYARLFSVEPYFRHALLVLATLVACWLVGTVLPLILACDPIEKAWERTVPGRCINTYPFFIGMALPNVLFDAGLLVLPMIPIWRLQMTPGQKLALSGVIGVGIFEFGVSICRLIVFVRLDSSDDPSWAYTQPAIWSVVEVNVGIICSCFMAMGPLLKKHWRCPPPLPPSFSSPRQQRLPLAPHDASWPQTLRQDQSTLDEMTPTASMIDHFGYRKDHQRNVTAESSNIPPSSLPFPLPHNVIHVQRDIVVTLSETNSRDEGSLCTP